MIFDDVEDDQINYSNNYNNEKKNEISSSVLYFYCFPKINSKIEREREKLL